MWLYGFAKTNQNVTTTEIHSLTSIIHTQWQYIAIDGQICFSRWLFADPAGLWGANAGVVGPLGVLLGWYGIQAAQNIGYDSWWLWPEATMAVSLACSAEFTAWPVVSTDSVSPSAHPPLPPTPLYIHTYIHIYVNQLRTFFAMVYTFEM